MTDLLEQDDFDIAMFLLQLCKKRGYYEEGGDQLEIDFLTLDKKLGEAQGIQERTCEQIVEFVDQHRERFL